MARYIDTPNILRVFDVWAQKGVVIERQSQDVGHDAEAWSLWSLVEDERRPTDGSLATHCLAGFERRRALHTYGAPRFR